MRARKIPRDQAFLEKARDAHNKLVPLLNARNETFDADVRSCNKRERVCVFGRAKRHQ